MPEIIEASERAHSLLRKILRTSGIDPDNPQQTSFTVDSTALKDAMSQAFWEGYYQGVGEYNGKEQETTQADEPRKTVASPVVGRPDGAYSYRPFRTAPEGKSGGSDVQAEVADDTRFDYSNQWLPRMQDSIQDLTAIGRDLTMAGIKPKFITRRIKQYQLNIDEIQAGKPLSTLHFSG